MLRTIEGTPVRRTGPDRLLAALILTALLLPGSAGATERPAVRIRWAEPPVAAKAGEVAAGRIELRAGVPGVVENLTITGPGWTLNTIEAPPRIFLNPGLRPTVSFRAVAADERAPLVVRFTFNGYPVEQSLQLDAASLEKAGRPSVFRFADGAPRVVGRSTPGVSGGQIIRFHGRIAYQRSDGQVLGVDSVVVRIMDDDSPSPFDEEIWALLTDVDGNFDVTLNWDDCDIGCDFPDVYLQIIANNGTFAVVDPDDDVWFGETPVIDNVSGIEVDFGLLLPDPAEFPPFHIYNNIMRARRHAALRGGMIAPTVIAVWPSGTTGAFYDRNLQEIHISTGEQWNEGTHVHELGHHLQKWFSQLPPSDYENGFCDQPIPGHCMWCPENPNDAWKEGWANWFGSIVNRSALATYGKAPLSLNDGRYFAEALGVCQDMVAYPGTSTEGYVTALLQDLDDASNDDHNGDAADCDTDILTILDGPIFTVFREDDPQTVLEFIEKFRLRYYEFDHNLWSTTRNVTPLFGFAESTPIIQFQPPSCVVARAGDTFEIALDANGSLFKYQWRRNGVELFDGGGVAGTDSATLTFSPAPAHMSGTYSCRVSTCSESLSVISLPVQVTILESSTPNPLLSWGENRSGQAGSGNLVTPIPPGLRALTDVVEVTGLGNHSVGLKSDGTVWTWGNPANGIELGNGLSFTIVTTPTQVADFDSVTQIAAGDGFTLALRLDGTVWGWGWNGFGNLGDSTQIGRARPARAKELEGCIKAIACGWNHSLALLENGTVIACGDNQFGQLGRGTIGGWLVEVQPVMGLSDVVAISADGYASMALKSDGTVWAWGRNFNGGLGIGTITDTPIATQVPGLTDVRFICKGINNGYAIRNDGSSWSWGDNTFSLLGDGQTTSQITHRTLPGLMSNLVNPVKIESAGAGFCEALMPNGTVRMWGYNDSHALGQPTPNVVHTPTVIPGVGGVANIGVGFRTVFALGQMGNIVATPEAASPVAMALRASPNPSFARTHVVFDLPTPGRVSLAVYDVAGRQVRSLVEGSREAGRYVEDWDGRGSNGGASLAGVYFVRLVAGGRTLSERVVRMR